MKPIIKKTLLTKCGQSMRPQLDESVVRMIRNNVLKTGESFYCAEEISGHINIWSGRGKQPQWITELLAKGITLDQMRAKA